MKNLIKYGILGTGRMAARMVPYIRESANSEVNAVASSDTERAAAFAGKLNIKRSYGDYGALLSDANIDAVYIALPNSMHFEFCKKALEHGKHVLCEKPFVLESKQLDILQNLAENSKLKIMECFWYRFHPLVALVKQYVGQELGDPVGYYSTFSFLNSDERDIRWNPALGGGALYDLMCYHLDAINHIVKPDLAKLESLEAFSRQRNGVEANINVEACFSDKFQVLVSSSIDRQSINRTTIVGTEATLVIPNLLMFPEIKDSFFYLLKNGKRQKIETGPANSYACMVRAFSDSVLVDSAPPISIAESKTNMRLLEAIRKSLRVEMDERVALFPKVKRKFGAILSRIIRKRAN